MALGELNNPALEGLWVRDVLPEPGGSSLVVAVIVDDARRAAEVLRQLGAARAVLRSEIAAAIHRKRTPHLRFVVLPRAAVVDEEEDDRW